MKGTVLFLLFILGCFIAEAQDFSGVNMGMGTISQLSNAKTRSISPENFTGQKGQGGMADPAKDKDQRNAANAAQQAEELGVGWKVNPFIIVEPGETFTLAEINESGVIQHIWMTPTGNWNYSILRMYWDGEKEPSVESPISAFFGMAWSEYAPLNSMPMTVNPGSAFNSFWPMPFREKAKITIENIGDREMRLYYQIDYAETEIGNDQAYFHAQYRRSKPTEGAIHTIIDGIKGKGQYVGTYLAVAPNNNGWWGEGEIKFYMDGDKKFPTINGTGLEDYFLGSYNYENQKTHQYEEYSTPFAGLHQVIRPDGLYSSQQRFGMYRWHIQDPIRFEKDLKVTIQDLGWRAEDDGRWQPLHYLQQQSEMISVAYWYQTEPHNSFPKLPTKQELEVN